MTQPFTTAQNQFCSWHNRQADFAYFRSDADAQAWLGNKPGYVIETTPGRIWRTTIFTSHSGGLTEYYA